jgi:hypothetical protein
MFISLYGLWVQRVKCQNVVESSYEYSSIWSVHRKERLWFPCVHLVSLSDWAGNLAQSF